MSLQKDLEKLYGRVDQEYDRVHGDAEVESTGDSSVEWTKVGREADSDVEIRSTGSWDHDGWDHDAARQSWTKRQKPLAVDAAQQEKELTAQAFVASVSEGSPEKAMADDLQEKFRAQ